jgi:hypothetical protein
MRWLGVALCVALTCAVASVPAGTQAQDKSGRAAAKGGSGAKATAKRAKKAKRATAKDKDRNAPVRSASGDKPAESAPATPATPTDTSGGHTPSTPSEDAAALAADADERVRKEDGEEIKTVEFGGLDIEGQLKTPQMLYFLNRLRAEFSRPELPHRSFIPELQRGTQENGF